MANGNILKKGTLYVGGTVMPLPTNPVSGGNVYNYNNGTSAIEFRDTGSVEANKINWVEVNLTAAQASGLGLTLPTGKMWIADRCLIRSITWNRLNELGLIAGTTVTIDGELYKVVSLTGGVNADDKNNMWDKIVCNSLGLSGLPTGTTGDTTEASASNQKWHWYNMYTWCQEVSSGNSSYRALRGYSSAATWLNLNATFSYPGVGFRPALIPLNSAPLQSDSDASLGDKSAPFTINYTVTENDSTQTFTLVEKVNGTTIRTLTGQTGGVTHNYTLDLSSVWSSLGIGTHTITITATDSQNASSVRTYTFVISNNVPTPPTHEYLNGMRVPLSGYIEFTPQQDLDNANLTMNLQFATNSAFSAGLQTFGTGLQRWNGTTWVNATNVAPSYYGVKHRLPYSGLTQYASLYMRVGASDGSATSYSTAAQLKAGNVLEFKTQPWTRASKPEQINVILDGTFSGDSAGLIECKVCNNALDASPTWEEATADFFDVNHAHDFTNATKTAADWAVQAWFVIPTGNATGAVEVRNISVGVTP